MRISLVLPGMTAGGAERVMSILANYWASHGHEVTLLALSPPEEGVFYPLHPAITWRPLGLVRRGGNPLRGLINNLNRIRVLRRELDHSRPDVVISFTQQVNVKVILATRGLNVPTLISEHSVSSQRDFGPLWTSLYAQVYPLADRVVVLTAAMRDELPARAREKAIIIPNPVLPPDPPVSADPTQNGASSPLATLPFPHTLLALGRLDAAKRFDRLIDAFAALADRHPDWQLVIWGEGALRTELEAQIARLHLQERVRLPGLTRTPYEELQKADLLAMTSAFEGFPMVLCEALACGLPAVCLETRSGVREILRDGIDGRIVPQGDLPAFTDALSSLMGDEDARKRLASRAPEVLERFGLEQVMARWDGAIDQVRAERR